MRIFSRDIFLQNEFWNIGYLGGSWRAATYATDGLNKYFFAIGDAGISAKSYNGTGKKWNEPNNIILNYTNAPSPSSISFDMIACSGKLQTNNVVRFATGSSLSPRTCWASNSNEYTYGFKFSAEDTRMNGVAYNNGKYVYVGADGTLVVLSETVSSNKVTWTATYGKFGYYEAQFIKYLSGFNKFMTATYRGAIWTSSNGTDWTNIKDESVGTYSWNDVAYGNNALVMIGRSSSDTSTRARISTDGGVTWSWKSISNFQGNKIEYLNGYFVVCGNGGKYAVLPDDLSNWTVKSTKINVDWRCLAVGNDTILMLGTNYYAYNTKQMSKILN